VAIDAAGIERYARQIIIPNVGIDGQERLCESVSLVVGDDVIATTAARYLSAAGSLIVSPKNIVQKPDVILCSRFAPQTCDLRDAFAESMKVPVVWWQLGTVSVRTGIIASVEKLTMVAKPSTSPPSPPPPAWLAAAAGADAAALACGVLLGWPLPPNDRELNLA
jgi:hypothetical protein